MDIQAELLKAAASVVGTVAARLIAGWWRARKWRRGGHTN